MSIPYFKKERGGVNPVGRIGLHIYRDPPKSITTRKSEKVNIGDIMNSLNPDSDLGDPTRTNEMINFYARGKNPMVEIDYGAGQGVSNPYKVEVVRPPLMPAATLNAISRPDVHQNYAIQSAPRIESFSVAGSIDNAKIDQAIRKDVKQGIIKVNPSITYYEVMQSLTNKDVASKIKTEDMMLRGSIRPTNTYSLDPTRDVNTLRSTAVGNANVYTVNSNIKFNGQTANPYGITSEITKNAIQDLRNFAITSNAKFGNIIVFDPKTNASLDLASTVKDKNYIAVTAAYGKPLSFNTNDGKEINLKDYTYSVVNTSIGNPQLIIQVNQPDIVLERNTPLFTASSNLKGTGESDMHRLGEGTITLEQNIPLTSINAGYSTSTSNSTENSRVNQNQIQLNKQGSFGEFNRYGISNTGLRQPVPIGLNKKEKYTEISKLGHQLANNRNN